MPRLHVRQAGRVIARREMARRKAHRRKHHDIHHQRDDADVEVLEALGQPREQGADRRVREGDERDGRDADDDAGAARLTNSGGHLTRVHVRSLRGYSIRNPRGG